MAIYKPTDCSPFNGTFDLSSDLPIVFECKIDTSNSPVTGYSIEIYNSNNEIIFPGVNRTTGPIKSNVTYLTDLQKYVATNFSSLLPNLKNINSGLNGSYLEIPFYVKEIDAKVGPTVSRNQMSENSIPNLVEGQTYTWKITLYQKGDSVSATTDDSIFPPNAEKYYDMVVTSGTIIGSNKKRIQTALIDSDDKVVDNLVLIDKFVQPIKIDRLSGYDPSNPVTSWSGTIPKSFTMTRSLISGYDSTYGYIYPSTAEDNAFAEGQIDEETTNGFQIFKNGNNPANLTATDMVELVYNEKKTKGEMVWKSNVAKPELSYWEQTYYQTADPNGTYYPLSGDYYSYPISSEERIIFNNIQESKVEFDKKYYGSPYNGVFKPDFSSKKIELKFEDLDGKRIIPAGLYLIKKNPSLTTLSCNISFSSFCPDINIQDDYIYSDIFIKPGSISYIENDVGTIVAYEDGEWTDEKCRYISISSDIKEPYSYELIRFYNWLKNNIESYICYQIKTQWLRTPDATTWGALSNKVFYCRQDGKNYEVNTKTQAGETNNTPFKFVAEKPVRIFDTVSKQSNTVTFSEDSEGLPGTYFGNVNEKISSLTSVVLANGVDITKNCLYSVGDGEIVIKTGGKINPDNIAVTYVPYAQRDYAGVIFYNKQTKSNSDTGIIYIRPSININKNMIFKEVTTTANPTWFNINYFNKDYNYITYIGNQGFNPEIDKTRYQIKSFYKDSDYNPFSIYKNPEIVSTISGNEIKSDGAINAITTRNFTVASTYDQNSYIQWKSYQWILYDSAKRTILEKTDEQYDGEITATFYGLDQQQYYILSLILQTNTGKIIEIDYAIYSDFTETAEQRDLVDAEFDCDTLSMKSSLKFLDVVLAPDAGQYLFGTALPDPDKDTAYYYNLKSDFYKKKKDQTTSDYDSIASVDSNGVLTITGQNSLDFSKSFENYAINSNTRTGDIQIDADEIVVEGSFYFSTDYNGDIFSVSRGEEGTGTITVSIPEAIKSIGSDGFVTLSDDINKVRIGPNSYLRIIDKNGMVSKELQNSSEFHNTSIWQVNGTVPNGDRINVANFQYAEVDFINQNDIPYPYEKGTILETINGENIIWNQLLDKSKYPATTTSSGVTFTNNGDGTITVNGTAGSTANAYFNVAKNISVIQGHKYYATMSKPIEHANFWLGLYANSGDAPFYGGTILDQSGKILTCVTSSDKLYVDINLYKNTSVSNATVKPQLFDLTQMFGADHEPATPEEFWSYFETNKVYLKNTYLNIVGPFNTNSSKAIRNPMGNNQQPFSFYDNENTAMQCKNGDQLVPFRINQPDKLIWVDNTPEESPKNVVINANGLGVTSAPRSVLLNEALIWNDDIIWKDGTYLKNGTGLSAKIGEVRVNGMVVEADTVSGTDPTYTNTGLVKQEKVSMSIKEREALSGYNLSFRIFINTNNFTIDQLRSACFVERKYAVNFAVNFAANWNTYGSGRMGTVKFLYANGTNYTSVDNNLNGKSFTNVVSVTFDETEGEYWSITYRVDGNDHYFSLEPKAVYTLTLTGDTTFISFTK